MSHNRFGTTVTHGLCSPSCTPASTKNQTGVNSSLHAFSFQFHSNLHVAHGQENRWVFFISFMFFIQSKCTVSNVARWRFCTVHTPACDLQGQSRPSLASQIHQLVSKWCQMMQARSWLLHNRSKNWSLTLIASQRLTPMPPLTWGVDQVLKGRSLNPGQQLLIQVHKSPSQLQCMSYTYALPWSSIPLISFALCELYCDGYFGITLHHVAGYGGSSSSLCRV